MTASMLQILKTALSGQRDLIQAPGTIACREFRQHGFLATMTDQGQPETSAVEQIRQHFPQKPPNINWQRRTTS
jgi:hypothetical protein